MRVFAQNLPSIVGFSLVLALSACQKKKSSGASDDESVVAPFTPNSGAQPGGGGGSDGSSGQIAPSSKLDSDLKLQAGSHALSWNELDDSSYEVFIRADGSQYDFEEPLIQLDEQGLTLPSIPGRFCFVVRATDRKTGSVKTSNEVCVGEAPAGPSPAPAPAPAPDPTPAPDPAPAPAPSPAPDTIGVTIGSLVSLENTSATLTAAASSTRTGAIALAFEQISGPAVTLTPSGSTVSFTTPDVASATFIGVKVTATLDELSATATAQVKVLPAFAFLGSDATTGSDWDQALLGRQGYWIPRGNAAPGASGAASAYPNIGQVGNDDLYELPAGVSLAWGAGAFHWIWANPSSAAQKAVFRPGQTSGLESCLFASSTLDVDVVQDDALRETRVLRVYTTDHENNRQADVLILDKDSGTELHRFELRATDANYRGAGAKGYWLSYLIHDDVTVRIQAVSGNAVLQALAFDAFSPANHAPTAEGSTRDTTQSAVTLGVSAQDQDGDELTYRWTQTGGPAVTLSDASAATPTFSAPSLGTYSFSVRVADWAGAYADAAVSVRVKETPAAPSFLGADATTGPDWLAAGYGTAGYFLPNAAPGNGVNTGSYPGYGQAGNHDLADLPDGVTLSWASNTHAYVWNDSSNANAKSVGRPDGTYTETCLYSEQKVAVRVTIGDASTRILRVYVTDHENNRELDVVLRDADSNAVVHTFQGRAADPQWRGAGSKGYWLSYEIHADVVVEVVNVSSVNAILQGLVWD